MLLASDVHNVKANIFGPSGRTMPFIHIKSLPFKEDVDISEIIIGVARDFSVATNILLEHVHTTWSFYRPNHYAKGDRVCEFQPESNFPILVDLLTPNFNDVEMGGVMMKSIANSISKRVSFPVNNIFINHRHANSEMVFDDGIVVKW